LRAKEVVVCFADEAVYVPLAGLPGDWDGGVRRTEPLTLPAALGVANTSPENNATTLIKVAQRTIMKIARQGMYDGGQDVTVKEPP